MLNAPDYWQTDYSNGLVMVIRNYHWLNSASRVLISTCSTPLVQMGERKQFSLFDLDLWPTILTYNPRLAKVKVHPHAKNQGQKSNGSNRRVPIDKQTDTHTHTHGRYQTYYSLCYTVDNDYVGDPYVSSKFGANPSTGALWVKYNQTFVYVFIPFRELAYRSDQTIDFRAWWLTDSYKNVVLLIYGSN